MLTEEAPTDPNNPMMGDEEEGEDKHNDYDTAVGLEFDIDPKHMDTANEGNTFMVHQPMNYARKWGFIAGGLIPVTLEKVVDAGPRSKYKATFHLTQANKRKFYLPYKDGEVPLKYDGPIEDKIEYISYRELQDLKSQGLDQPGGAGGGAPGGMPGGDMMGGMGGPPGGM